MWDLFKDVLFEIWGDIKYYTIIFMKDFKEFSIVILLLALAFLVKKALRLFR
jgi:hypothetical protein